MFSFVWCMKSKYNLSLWDTLLEQGICNASFGVVTLNPNLIILNLQMHNYIKGALEFVPANVQNRLACKSIRGGRW
jgi:hypothetical protein